MGKPGPDFNWAAYDVLLLDYDLGNGQTGTDWLRESVHSPGFPRTILITGVGDSYVVADAIKLGAEGYLNKAAQLKSVPGSQTCHRSAAAGLKNPGFRPIT